MPGQSESRTLTESHLFVLDPPAIRDQRVLAKFIPNIKPTKG